MKKWILFGFAFAAIAGLYFTTRHDGVPAGVIGKNSTEESLAPDFSLPDLTAKKLDLASYRGKVVLLDFWATWCDPCRDEIPHFVALQNKYGGQGLQIIGVSMDDGPEPVREFYRRFKMNYPVVMGNANTGELYGGVLGLPIAFLIGRDGRIRAKHIGATDISVFEKEIVDLLRNETASSSQTCPLPSNVRGAFELSCAVETSPHRGTSYSASDPGFLHVSIAIKSLQVRFRGNFRGGEDTPFCSANP